MVLYVLLLLLLLLFYIILYNYMLLLLSAIHIRIVTSVINIIITIIFYQNSIFNGK